MRVAGFDAVKIMGAAHHCVLRVRSASNKAKGNWSASLHARTSLVINGRLIMQNVTMRLEADLAVSIANLSGEHRVKREISSTQAREHAMQRYTRPSLNPSTHLQACGAETRAWQVSAV